MSLRGKIKHVWGGVGDFVGRKWRVMLIGSGIVAGCLFVLYFKSISQCLFETQNNTTNPLGELLKVCVTAIAGVGVFITFRYLGRQVRAMEKGNADTRFNIAVEHLGSNSPTIVLGGIHALHQIAVSDKNYTQVVHNLFCSYLRENSAKLNKAIDLEKTPEKCPIIIQTLIYYLFKPYNNKESVYKDFKTDLSFVKLKNCNFEKAMLNNSDFYKAILTDCYLSGANLTNCDFFGAALTKCRFVEANLTNCSFNATTLTHCGFRKANLTKCHFWLATLADCVFWEATLTNYYFSDITLIDTKLPPGTEYTLLNDPLKHIAQ